MPGLGGSSPAYSKATHIPGPQAGAAPFSLKARPLCLQYSELDKTGVVFGRFVCVCISWCGEVQLSALCESNSITHNLPNKRIQMDFSTSFKCFFVLLSDLCMPNIYKILVVSADIFNLGL